jgi:hypothetical protein
MTAAEAALEAARLGLFGTIAVGILATVGTLAGTLLGPFLIRKAELNATNAQRRRDELAELIPDVIVKGIAAAATDADAKAVGETLALQAKLGVLLRPDEWQIAAIARIGLLLTESDMSEPDTMPVAARAATILPVWARGEISSAQAAAMFERDTGKKITRVTPDPERKRR